MEVIIIGSGVSIPSKERGYPGILLKINHKNILLDSGPGTLKRLAEIGVYYTDLDYIFYTHFHPDHCLDLVSILFAMRNPKPVRKKPLFIIGPRGLKEFYVGINQLFKDILRPKTYELFFREVSRAWLKFKGLRVECFPLNHIGPCIGYRIEDKKGKSLAYSGDTDYCENLIKLAKNADLFILECSLPDRMKVRGHMTPSECGKVAKEANCKKLVLTHFYPVYRDYKDIINAVKKQYRGEVILAKDMLEIRIK